MTAFCRSCGDIVVGDRCGKCYGRPVQGFSQFSDPADTLSPNDRWKQKYDALAELRLMTPVHRLSLDTRVPHLLQSIARHVNKEKQKDTGNESCDDLVIKDSIEHGRKVWHMDCFQCSFCNIDLSKSPTVNMQSQPCCQVCLSKNGALEGYTPIHCKTDNRSGKNESERSLDNTLVEKKECAEIMCGESSPGSPDRSWRAGFGSPNTSCTKHACSDTLSGGLSHLRSHSDASVIRKPIVGASPRSLRVVPVQNRMSIFNKDEDPQSAAYLAERRPRRNSPTIRPSSSSPSLQDQAPLHCTDDSDPNTMNRSSTYTGGLNNQLMSAFTPRSPSPIGIPRSPTKQYGVVSPTRQNLLSWRPTHGRSKTVTFGDATKSSVDCKKCNETLKGTTVTLLDGSRYHKTCFTCDGCKDSFEETKYVNYSGKYYHVHCVPKIVPHLRLQTDPRASLQNFEIPISPASSIFASRDRPLPRLGAAEKCPACHVTITYFEQKPGPHGTKWHEKCRACSECKKKMDSCALNEIEDGTMKLYCRQCWDFIKKGRKRLTAPIGSFHAETLRNFGKLGAI
ncbi:Cysteine and glycine-rich protein 3 [Neolecta irregularis DAH-3]|uniref:Cysteine and glycine-rich protein 3 n=1 Tax=Neolecta irregularis (strain DAH-3) TaxID=1198029 RepID=A0A1U7LWT5_NEOID|nr:Cysteine and glycine-rich protein 3 [Neolecta irregularis DAH-3]|eukprot:OLL26971.1 Cysteine and glycine-rich protein 3 [Neolecta irregularis DAH-3]